MILRLVGAVRRAGGLAGAYLLLGGGQKGRRLEPASEGVEEAEEGPEPRVPGQDPPADPPGAFDYLAGDLDEGRKKVRKSIVRRRRRCSLCSSAQRGLTGSSRAHQAFMLQARAAITM